MTRLYVLALFALIAASPAAAAVSDEQARAAIIQQSLASYPGPCPCPYNRMRNGRACGSVSAYVRPGGYSPICYDRDVTPDMIRKFRGALGE